MSTILSVEMARSAELDRMIGKLSSAERLLSFYRESLPDSVDEIRDLERLVHFYNDCLVSLGMSAVV